MDHGQFCDMVLLVDPSARGELPDVSDFKVQCNEVGCGNSTGLNFMAFQAIFNDGPLVSASTFYTRLNLRRQGSQQAAVLSQHGPAGHTVYKFSMSYVDTGVVISSDMKTQYTLSLVFTLHNYPEATGSLLHIQNEVGPAALEVNSDGRLVVFGSVCDGKLSLSDSHTLIMSYTSELGYGYVVIDSKVVTFFQSRHKKYLIQRYIVVLNGLEGSVSRLILDSQVMSLSKARAPSDATSQEDFFDRVVGTGFQPSLVKLVFKEARNPWTLCNFFVFSFAQPCIVKSFDTTVHTGQGRAHSHLASGSYFYHISSTEFNIARHNPLSSLSWTFHFTTLLLQRGLQYILTNLQRLVATEPDVVIDPIIARDSSKINIDTIDEKKATASQSLSMIPEQADDDNNDGAGDTSSNSFYAVVAAANGNVLGDVPRNVPLPLTKKSTAREKKQTAKADENFDKFRSSRIVSEKSLTLVYARTALLTVLAGDPQKLFAQDFACVLRTTERSFPEGLGTLRELLVDAILREVPDLILLLLF